MSSFPAPFFSKSTTAPGFSHRKGIIAFSLIELLVVIAVISIVVSLAAMSIASLGSSSRLNQAGNLAVDMIQQAQHTARTANSIALLMFAKEETGNSRLMSIYQWSTANNTWRQVTRWESLPEGIEIDNAESQLVTSPLAYTPPTVTLHGEQLAADRFTYQAFLPDGRLLANSNPVLHIHAPPRPENYYRIVITTATGLPIIERP